MSVIKQNIRDIQNRIDGLSMIEKEIITARESAANVEVKLRETLEQLEKKNIEIEKLQSFSLTGLVSSIFIDKKYELERKRNEYYQLSKDYDNLKSEQAASEIEVQILNKKLNELGVLRQELQVMIENRENELKMEDSSQGKALLNVEKDLEDNDMYLSKLKRSLELTDRIFSTLTLFSAALRDVESSLSWNRKKQFAGITRDTAIRKAKEFNVDSRLMLNDLGKILRELDIDHGNIDIALVAFENEFGIFFDNFISDIIMKKRIIEGVNNIEYAFQNLKMVKSKIESKINDTEMTVQRLKSVKDKILRE
ncbi:MAG: hypothetical protein ACM3PT_07145 [Deltaproteobacteria bacterium]